MIKKSMSLQETLSYEFLVSDAINMNLYMNTCMYIDIREKNKSKLFIFIFHPHLFEARF